MDIFQTQLANKAVYFPKPADTGINNRLKIYYWKHGRDFNLRHTSGTCNNRSNIHEEEST